MFEEFAMDGSQPSPTGSAMPEPRWSQHAQLEAARAHMEVGPGGDVDLDGRLTRMGRGYVPGLKRTVSIWLRLYERVQHGELGGAHDGRPPAASTQRAPGAGSNACAAKRTRPGGAHDRTCSRLPGGEAPVVSL